ncbi:beta-ketoacyl-ACP synthase III [Streptomyces sp. 796.1]|uniref:beta-ketoacyl-ACP synthase III n=1 Tax=Streptomyces sp. 796.1 TaxID=3163029 RepID=UPI0039C9A274
MTSAAVVCGLGAWVPPTVVPNAALVEELDTSDEWIRTRTGIAQRHLIAPGDATSDLAVEAGRRALESARRTAARHGTGGTTTAAAGAGEPGTTSGRHGAGSPSSTDSPDDADGPGGPSSPGGEPVDLLVLATSTPDHPCPATAPAVAARLGLGSVAAFDVGAVCTGFVYALATAASMLTAGVATRALVIGADTFSTILNPGDRTTRAIFGDGAGAVVLRAGRADEPGALLGFDLGSDGAGADLITVRAGGSRQRSTAGPAPAGDEYFTMAGRAVFTQAVLNMSKSALALVDRIGWSQPGLDRVVAHQANARILRAVGDQLGLADEQVVSNLDRVGNTVAGSIPLALADAVRAGDLRPGQRVLLTGFGGGLTWGSTALIWPDLSVDAPHVPTIRKEQP